MVPELVEGYENALLLRCSFYWTSSIKTAGALLFFLPFYKLRDRLKFFFDRVNTYSNSRRLQSVSRSFAHGSTCYPQSLCYSSPTIPL